MTKPLNTSADYTEFLHAIKSRVHDARIAASRVVNRGLVALYWSIGRDIVEKQDKLGWGKSVVERLSKDLKSEFPGTSGFSTQNLWYMRQVYMEYRDSPNLQQLVGEISPPKQVSFEDTEKAHLKILTAYALTQCLPFYINSRHLKC